MSIKSDSRSDMQRTVIAAVVSTVLVLAVLAVIQSDGRTVRVLRDPDILL